MCTVSAFPFNPRFFFFFQQKVPIEASGLRSQTAQIWEEVDTNLHEPPWSRCCIVFLSRSHHSYNNLLAGHNYHQKWWVALEKVQEKHRANSLSAAKKLHVKARKPVTCCYCTPNVRTSTWLWREALNTFLR